MTGREAMSCAEWIDPSGEPPPIYPQLEAIRARPGLYIGDQDEPAGLKCLGLVLDALWEIARRSSPRGTPADKVFVLASRDQNDFTIELRWGAYVNDPCPDLRCIDAARLFPQHDPDGGVGSKLAIVNALTTGFQLTARLCGNSVTLTGEDGEQTSRRVAEIPRDGRHRLHCRFRLNGDVIETSGLTAGMVTGYVLRFSHERPGLVYRNESDHAKRESND